MTSLDPKSWLIDKLGDIANVEVNTMVAEISARKPPPWPDTLREISETYIDYLKKNGKATDLQFLPKISDVAVLTNIFEELQKCAQNEIVPPGTIRQASDDATRIILFRIRKSCEEIVGIISDKDKRSVTLGELRGKQIKLNADERIKIRKIWELGTNRVVMQTVMQLDGDIVSRVSANRINQDEMLLQLHNTSLSQSITYWNMVLNLIAQFARGWFGKLFGGS